MRVNLRSVNCAALLPGHSARTNTKEDWVNFWQQVGDQQYTRDDGVEVRLAEPGFWRGFFGGCQTLRYRTASEAISATHKMFPRRPMRRAVAVD